jgi:hypothetical protein
MHRYGDERRDVIWSHSFALAISSWKQRLIVFYTNHTTAGQGRIPEAASATGSETNQDGRPECA